MGRHVAAAAGRGKLRKKVVTGRLRSIFVLELKFVGRGRQVGHVRSKSRLGYKTRVQSKCGPTHPCIPLAAHPACEQFTKVVQQTVHAACVSPSGTVMFHACLPACLLSPPRPSTPSITSCNVLSHTNTLTHTHIIKRSQCQIKRSHGVVLYSIRRYYLATPSWRRVVHTTCLLCLEDVHVLDDYVVIDPYGPI